MIYPNTYEQKIGFDQIRGRLTALCLCSLGEGLVRDMAFSVSFDDIRRQVKQTMEFVRILKEEDFPDQNFFDVRPSLKRIRIQNTCLDVEELFNLQRSLATIDNIVTFLHRCQDEENTIPSFPHLYGLTADVKTYPQMVRRIDQILDLLPEAQGFVLPGGTVAASQCHVCRTVCRRAERRIAALAETEIVGQEIMQYVNRLSDYLFVLAKK